MQNITDHVNPSKSATHFCVSEFVSRATTSCETQPQRHVDRLFELSALIGKA